MAVKAVIGEAEYALAPLTESLGFLTRVVQVQINERIRAGGGVHVSLAVFSALRLFQANPGIRQTHAARILLIQESNMASLVKDLLEQGLIERRGDAGRRGGLWITAKGEGEIAQGAWTDKIDRSYTRVLSDQEYRQLVQLLNRVYRASLA